MTSNRQARLSTIPVTPSKFNTGNHCYFRAAMDAYQFYINPEEMLE